VLFSSGTTALPVSAILRVFLDDGLFDCMEHILAGCNILAKFCLIENFSSRFSTAISSRYQVVFGVAVAETGSTGRFNFRHASNPPSSGRTCLNPSFLNSSATRALVASFGQLQ
jgi:hypothetical protein